MIIIETLTIGGAIAFTLVIAYLVVKSRYKKAGPDEALIVFGRRKLLGKKVRDVEGTAEGFRIVHGGGTFIWPGWESFERLSLKMMTLEINMPHVYTEQGIPINVKAVAQVKIQATDDFIKQAAEAFLGVEPSGGEGHDPGDGGRPPARHHRHAHRSRPSTAIRSRSRTRCARRPTRTWPPWASSSRASSSRRSRTSRATSTPWASRRSRRRSSARASPRPTPTATPRSKRRARGGPRRSSACNVDTRDRRGRQAAVAQEGLDPAGGRRRRGPGREGRRDGAQAPEHPDRREGGRAAEARAQRNRPRAGRCAQVRDRAQRRRSQVPTSRRRRPSACAASRSPRR